MRRLVSRLGSWLMEAAGPAGAYVAGVKNMDKGAYETAVEAFEQFERQSLGRSSSVARVAESVGNRAFCLLKLGAFDRACQAYEEALRREEDLRGTTTETHKNLTRHLAVARQHAELSRARQLDPTAALVDLEQVRVVDVSSSDNMRIEATLIIKFQDGYLIRSADESGWWMGRIDTADGTIKCWGQYSKDIALAFEAL